MLAMKPTEAKMKKNILMGNTNFENVEGTGITVELTRRRESKHPAQHQVSCETRSRRSRPTICSAA
jgi:hypothetical protein